MQVPIDYHMLYFTKMDTILLEIIHDNDFSIKELATAESSKTASK